MSSSVDQYMQVKCKFQLSSDTESSESIHSNNETVRLCTSAELDKNSTLVVMICSNGSGNNHIVAYLVQNKPNLRVIVKQIYYNPYNEDIVAICLNECGTKLTLINASSTIYILPIKNILLKQLRSSQEKSMYFYDASILYSCSLDDPAAIAHWDVPDSENKTLLIVASERGKISFINVEDKKEVCLTRVNDRIKNLKIVKDRVGHFLLITCENTRQYRFALDLLKQPEYMNSDKSHKLSCQPHTNNFRRIHKLASLESDEVIVHLVLTERFLVLGTDKNRCMVNSRNCCDLKNLHASKELDPLIKEITFSNGEKILQVLKSPVTNDQDGIIDSFLLVTTRSIYSIEARQSCRDMFINLIDNHLGMEPSQERKRLAEFSKPCPISSQGNHLSANSYTPQRKNSQSHSNLMVNNFLNHKAEVYERISYDSRVFSILFKLELNSLYEAYGDKLLIRGHFKLANRFFQMAQFNYIKIVGKYTRLGAIKPTPEPSGNYMNKYSNAALLRLDLFREFLVRQQSQQPVDDKSGSELFGTEQKHLLESVFYEYLNACLDDSSEDPSRLWFNYINFYLNYVDTIEALELDILNLLDTDNDCRLAITLYRAIGKAEDGTLKPPDAGDRANTPFESMSKIYNLSNLFRTEFLMKLLDKTVELVHQSTDLSAINECLAIGDQAHISASL